MKILFLSPYPHSSADTRYRIEQYLPGLREIGVECTLRPFMSERFFQIYAAQGHTPEKLAHFAVALSKRLIDILTAAKYDVIFMHKEAFAFGPPAIESLLKALSGKLIFDLDDAFWSHPPQLNQIAPGLRDGQKTLKLLRLSDHVVAGNRYIAERISPQARAVTILPTVVDTRYYRPRDRSTTTSRVTIGWVGRWSSAFYLDPLVPVFQGLCRRYPSVTIKLIGAGPKSWPGVRLINLPWHLQSEIDDLQDIDIGIMPLPDDEYSRYKCGFKMLQYMGLAIPAVVSPVGVNQDVICDDENGFLASTPEEWSNKLVQLIENPALRRRLGDAGRQTIEANYSLARASPILHALIHGVVSGA
jgi:glycosyltransferase involved in cell wall biosynthesis